MRDGWRDEEDEEEDQSSHSSLFMEVKAGGAVIYSRHGAGIATKLLKHT